MQIKYNLNFQHIEKKALQDMCIKSMYLIIIMTVILNITI